MGKIIISLLLFSASASALEVIHDSGNTTPAAPYYRSIKPITDQSVSARINVPDTQPVTLESYFPLVTSMQIGVPTQKIVEQMPAPLFVIGMDNMSVNWLEQNLTELQAIGARGVIVSGNDYQAFLQLQSQASALGIVLSIGPGDAIAKAYLLTTYPVLIQ